MDKIALRKHKKELKRKKRRKHVRLMELHAKIKRNRGGLK